jgi:Gas vesicle synthesis protein GvpL/GvpF
MDREIAGEPARQCGHRQGPEDYVYAIAERLPRRWRPPARGVGAAPVVARRIGDLVVITSPVDAVPPSSPAAVARHGQVISATLTADAVLPLPFGTLVPTVEIDGWLAGHRCLIEAYLSSVRCRLEMAIRLVSLNPGAQARASLRVTAERLVEHSGLPDWRYVDAGIDSLVSSVAFLVHRDAVGEFLARVAPVAARARDVAVVPTGPSAPASFAPRLPLPAAPDRLARAG